MRAERGFLESLVDAAQLLIVVLDTEGRIVLFNRACQETTGYSAEEALGHDWFDLFVPERVKEGAGEVFQKLLDGQLPSHYENPILTKDGQERLVEWDNILLRDEKGTVHHVVGTGRDITERKQAEEALARHNRELAALNAVVAVVSRSLNIEQVTEQAIDLIHQHLGYTNVALLLVDEKTDELYIKAACGYLRDVQGLRLKIGQEGITGWVAAHREPLLVPDVRRDPRYFMGAEEILSELAVPVMLGEELLGVLDVESDKVDAFDADDLKTLTTLAGQLAVAIKNAWLYQAERKRATQLAVVNQVARQAASILELDQLLQEMVTAVQQSFKYYHVGLFLLNEAAGELNMQAIAGGFEDVIAPDYCQAVGEGMIGWTAETGQSLLSNDVSRDPRYIPGFLEEVLTKSELCVPLKLAGQVIGVLDIQSTQLNAFDETDLLAMEALAGQIAMAIENARLFRETKRRLEETMALYQTSLDITAQLEMSELLNSIVERAVTLLQAEAGGIYLYDPEREELRWVIGYDYTEKYVGVTLKPGEGMAGKVFQTGEPLIVDDYRTWEGRAPVYETDQPFTAVLEVPLKWQDRISGVLSINADVQKRTFNQDDLWLATLFANQVAVAIENARLYEETQQRADEMAALYDTALAIAAKLDTGQLLQTIVERATDLLNGMGGAMYLYRPEQNDLELVLTHKLKPDFTGTVLRRGEGLSGKVLESGEPIIVDCYQEWSGRSPLYEEAPFEAVIAAPVKWRHQILGIINVLREREAEAFDDQDMRLLTLFANQAAVAIENARIYEEERKRVTQLELIGGVTQKIASILDLDELLPQVAYLIRDTFGYYYTSILLVEADSDELILRAASGPFIETVVSHLRLKIGQKGITGWVAHSGEPLLVNDVSREPRYYFVEESRDTRSELAVPIKLKEEIIGVLDVQSVELDAFGEDDVSILQTLADQLAVAIENARLYEAEAQQRQEAETLRRAAMALTSTLDLEEALDRILEQLHRVVAYDSASVQLLGDDHLKIVGGRGFADPLAVIGLRFPTPGDNPNARVIESGEPVILADAQTAHAPFRESPHDHIRSWLGVPMRFREQIIGMIALDSTELGHFTADHARLAAAFANQAAVAIENARLYQQVVDLAAELEVRVQERTAELIHKARELSFLYQASVNLSSSLERDEVLNILARQAALVMDTVDCAIYELQDDALVIVARHRDPALPWKDPEIGRRYLLANCQATRDAIEKGQPLQLRVDDPLADKAKQVELQEFGYTALLQVHIVSRGQVVGIVEVFDNKPEREFGEDDAALLQTIANQASMAIERAGLYEETRRRAQEIAQQKEQTDAIVQSMADGLIVTDLEHSIVLANPAAEELLKFRLKDAIGQEIGASIRDDRLCQIVRDTLDKQQAGYEVDIELTDPYDEAQRIMRAHTAVVNDPSGQPMGIVTTLRDMTHEREVQRLKDELINTVSHELRTPMTSVLGFSELLLNRQLSEERRQLCIQTIHKEAQRLSALINDFLDIQRMERGKQEYHFEEVDLGELAREMIATYSGQSEAHTLTLDLPPELPSVQADADCLRQVFGNLLSNAIKFSPGEGTVAVSVQVWGDTIRVAVSDEGIGIPAEALTRIFEKFFRVDSSDLREIKGTGLGLAICKELVEAHGGRIWAESEVGTGTTITFSLPMRVRNQILVIDDEGDIREMFQRLLSERSYEVLTAAHGQEALSLMEEELPDLVILDIAMPVMNGYQFLEKAKADRRMKDIPVIAISGVDTDIDRLEELGIDEFLSKPFSSTVLLDTMQRLLKRP
ncbi:MAG: GAF domain-containing protein [Anaerolineae bacterium]